MVVRRERPLVPRVPRQEIILSISRLEAEFHGQCMRDKAGFQPVVLSILEARLVEIHLPAVQEVVEHPDDLRPLGDAKELDLPSRECPLDQAPVEGLETWGTEDTRLPARRPGSLVE